FFFFSFLRPRTAIAHRSRVCVTNSYIQLDSTDSKDEGQRGGSSALLHTVNSDPAVHHAAVTSRLHGAVGVGGSWDGDSYYRGLVRDCLPVDEARQNPASQANETFLFRTLTLIPILAVFVRSKFNAAIDAICDRYNAHDYNKRIYYRLGQTFDHESSTNYRPVSLRRRPIKLSFFLLSWFALELVISLGLRTTQYITTNNEVVIAMNAIHGEDDADTADTADHVDALPLYTPPQVTPSVDQPPLAPPSTVDGAPPKYVP
ncbi:hypothetical protein BC936DRAFT_148515, partial [Jimgerdemannia flammicorona]